MILRRAAWCVSALVALSLTLAACGDDGGVAGAQYEISGEITDALSGKAIKGAKVIFKSDTNDTKSTKTNDEGRYEMSVTSGSLFGQVRAEKDGYEPAEQSVYFDTKSRRIDIEMREALPDAGL